MNLRSVIAFITHEKAGTRVGRKQCLMDALGGNARAVGEGCGKVTYSSTWHGG
jgi:hypothetical protein